MELREYLSVLDRRKRIVLAVFLGTLAVALAVTLLRPATYTSTATLRVEPGTALVGGSVQADDVKYLDRLVNTYAQLATSRELRERLASELQLDAPPRIRFEQLPSTNLVDLKVTTGDRDKAAPAATRAASLLIAQLGTLAASDARAAERSFAERTGRLERQKAAAEAQLAELQAAPSGQSERMLELREEISGTGERLAALRADHERYESSRDANARGVTRIDEPAAPQHADNRDLALALALGLLLAAIAGPGAAFIAENLSRRFRSGDEIEASVGAPVLTAVPIVEGTPSGTLFNSRSPAQEAFRRLRTTLLRRAAEQTGGLDEGLTLLITSAHPGEGKSTVAANLGRSLAQTGRSTLLVDADLRMPVLHRFFGVESERGLSDILRGMPAGESSDWPDLVQPTGVPGLLLLPAGAPVDDAPMLLGSPSAARLFAELGERFDHVVVDSPAVLAVTDALVLTRHVDLALLVAGSNVQRDALRLARQELTRVGATLLGVVVNGADDRGLYPYVDYPYLSDGTWAQRRAPTVP
jgi:capsular exopolysaccharide synthesis family protein